MTTRPGVYLSEAEHGVAVIELRGEVDSRAAEAIRDATSSISLVRVLFDVSHVHAISSMGLRALVAVKKQVERANGRVVLCGLAEDLSDQMWSVGFLEQFETSASRQEAYELFGQAPPRTPKRHR